MAGHQKIESFIEAEAAKLIQRQRRYETGQVDEAHRIERRSGHPVPVEVHRPSYWHTAPGFDPFHTKHRASSIAHSIHRGITGGVYQPRPAVTYKVSKGLGEWRAVSVFQVADNAISRMVYKDLMAKNGPRLSPRCYSYRTDITLHDAIAYIATELRTRPRLYLAEFDFRKFFDSISHEHIERTLRDRRFFVTDRELQVIRAFLRAPSLEQSDYSPTSSAVRTRGIPQGTSISLFLADAAALTLDEKLERLGVQFARYADDTLIWSNDYGEICRAVEALSETAAEMGVAINLHKSEGVSILAGLGEKAEFRDKARVDFIGYSISKDNIGIRPSSVARIKKRMAFIIFSNLLQEPLRGSIVPARFAPYVDRDYLVMIQQLRRYLYGDVNEMRLRQYLARTTPRIHYKGLMSFYPIVDDEASLRELDGWLIHTVHTSLRRRKAILASFGHSALPSPHNKTRDELPRLWGRTVAGLRIDLRLPSLVRIGKLIRRAAQQHGANAIANKKSAGYYSEP